MFCSNRKPLLFLNGVIQRTPPSPKLMFQIQCNPPTLLAKCSTSSSNLQSFTTSYLVEKCGFSPEIALSISKHIQLKTAEKPDSVWTFFRNYGFSHTQILRLVQFEPKLLLSDPFKSFLPKFDFFHSKGISSSEVIEMATASPVLLTRSLENHIIPCFNVLKTLLQSDQIAISYIKRWTNLISQHNFRTNIQVLSDNGVPELYVRRLLLTRPLLFVMSPSTFRNGVEKVKELGFSPSHSRFLIAFKAMNCISKAKWEKKTEIFKKWGWTDDVILEGFRKYPNMMLISEGKLIAVMDFWVNQLGWDSLMLARRPILLDLSLGERIIPRTAVLLFLSSVGLIKKASLVTPLVDSENLFLQRYVERFKEEAPQLMKLYEEKIEYFKKQKVHTQNEL